MLAALRTSMQASDLLALTPTDLAIYHTPEVKTFAKSVFFLLSVCTDGLLH
jgi:hypothetical protein